MKRWSDAIPRLHCIFPTAVWLTSMSAARDLAASSRVRRTWIAACALRPDAAAAGGGDGVPGGARAGRLVRHGGAVAPLAAGGRRVPDGAGAAGGRDVDPRGPDKACRGVDLAD